MGLDFEILENEYNKIAADKAEVEARTDLTDEERQTTLAGFDRALGGLEEGIVTLATKTKQDMQAIINGLEAKVKANEEYIKSAEEEMKKRQAEIEEEMAKENPDQGVIEAKQAEIKALEKRIKGLKTATRKVQKEIKEQNKLLIPLMKRFGDKVFTAEEIADLEKLDKKIQSGKALADKMKKQEEQVAEEPVQEEQVEEEPVQEEQVEEEPVQEEQVEEEPAQEEQVAEEPAQEEQVEEEPSQEEQVEEEPSQEEPVTEGTAAYIPTNGGSARASSVGYVVDEPVSTTESVEQPKKSLKDEFDELYKKAKARTLTQDDFDKLVEITSDPTNYDRLDITTGILRNKSKVILKAMGDFATTNIHKSVSDAKEYFGIEAEEPSETITPTYNAYSWKGIKSIAENPNIRFASQDVLERVVMTAKEIGIENLNEEQRETLKKASKHLKNIYGFEDSIAAYSEVKTRRREERMSWFKNKALALAEPVEEELVNEEEPVAEEPKNEHEFKEDEFFWEYTDGEYTEPVDSFASKLKSDVYPPAEVKDVVKDETETTDKEITTDFDGPGIDG